MLDLQPLSAWFRREKRDLPWRIAPTPYAVWVSEVMLQQTQVKTVIPYFLRWMEQFPTVRDLAEAPLEAVIKAWEGLGYYSRARNLHEGAKTCLRHYRGQLPKEHLDQIKGIGPYTKGAILSFAFHEKAAAIDGNVRRVLSRLLARDPSSEEMEKILLDALPDHKPWESMEALIELGATLCMKKPTCSLCPLRHQCRAYSRGEVDLFPQKKKTVAVTKIVRHALILKAEEHLLLKKIEAGQIMAGLWEFPYFESTFPKHFNGLSLHTAKPLSPVTHTFTRYKATLFAYLMETPKIFPVETCLWVPLKDVEELPFSSGHRRLLWQLTL